MSTFQIIYTLLGGLGIFFYGMRTMSDALQQAASEVITKVINSLTTNRFLAVVVGMIVTMIVQSSSVTTVMVVGFVNAGLMQLTQAIGVILGSNIGTTVTGWIISIKIGKYGLLLIGLGIFPALFSKNPKLQSAGKALFGVGMVFTGLEFMSGAFKPLRNDPGFLDMISYFSGQDYGSYIASVITGCLLTMIIQSSSAMLGITIALASTGVIEFPTAAALVMGENVGTTITALLASVGANVNAKRAARAHAIFNTLGVVLMLAFFPVYIEFIEWLIPGAADAVAADGSKPQIAQHIAASHTIFNVGATLAFLPFLNQLARLVQKITPDKKVKETPKLVLLGEASDILPATAIIQADTEVRKMKDILERMYGVTKEYLKDKDPKKLAKARDYERITDNIQKEITLFLCKVMERPMSAEQSRHSQALIKVADEFESIADYLERIVNYKARFKNDPQTGPTIDEYKKFMEEVWSFFQICAEGIFNVDRMDRDQVFKKSEELRIWADDIRDRHLDRVSKGDYEPLSALTYSDMVVALRKIRAHALNVAEAVSMTKPVKDIR
ncbi:MAG: Na/Pi cotransporter family protein [Bacteriovoracaceae bacterium]|nr:Na/Pi cotransporter family protein [Bacteriovoracaceae bacterium]